MKKHLPVALLFFLIQSSLAQNWSVINLSDKFNYRLDNDPIITATIWTDSVEANGNDSVFYLNRIMCDTCVTIVGGPLFCDTCYAAINRPQFFQRKISASPYGIVNFLDTGNIVLNTHAQLNDSWLFDSTWNISATVIAFGMDSVFGNYDSVKTILLTSGDTIIQSENYGTIQFPKNYGMNSYYRLVGIEGRNLGEQVPKFFDFFDIHPGDQFEYHSRGSIGADCSYWEIIQYTITSRSQAGDSITFGLNGTIVHYEYQANWWNVCNPIIYCGPINNLSVGVDSTDHFTNKVNNEAFNLSHHLQNGIPCLTDSFAYDHVRMFKDSNQVITKSFGSPSDSHWTFEYCFYDPLTQGSDTFYIANQLQMYSATYKVGLGMTDYANMPCFEGYDEQHLTAYVKNGDTVGVFTPNLCLLLSETENAADHFQCMPNPASSHLIISFPTYLAAEIILNDIQGKILMTNTIRDSIVELDVSKIEDGLYFLTIKSPDGIYSKKVLIQH